MGIKKLGKKLKKLGRKSEGLLLGNKQLKEFKDKNPKNREYLERLGIGGSFTSNPKRHLSRISDDWKDLIGKTAAEEKRDAAEAAAAETEAAGQQAGNMFEPYQLAGQQALQARQSALGLGGQPFDPSVITNNPAYQFALQQGIGANQAAFAGTGLVGRQAMELTRFASGLASSSYQDYINNLTNASNTGLQATSQRAQIESGTTTSAIETRLAGQMGTIGVSEQGAAEVLKVIAAMFGA